MKDEKFKWYLINDAIDEKGNEVQAIITDSFMGVFKGFIIVNNKTLNPVYIARYTTEKGVVYQCFKDLKDAMELLTKHMTAESLQKELDIQKDIDNYKTF